MVAKKGAVSMAIVDAQGRLFGRLNLLDAVLLVLVVVRLSRRMLAHAAAAA